MQRQGVNHAGQPHRKSGTFVRTRWPRFHFRRSGPLAGVCSLFCYGLLVTGCSHVPCYPLRFERVARSGGTAFQAQADGTLGKDRTEFAFTITRSTDVGVIVSVSASLPGTQTRLIRSSGWTGESVACVPDNSGTTCYASMEKARPGNYSIITGRGSIASKQEVTVRVFAGVHGPGLVEFPVSGESGPTESGRRETP